MSNGPVLCSSCARRGFTFAEIMFAVVILGLGFIMVAAMLPVAIQQSESTSDETMAVTVARNAIDFLQSIADDPLMPKTGALFGVDGPLERVYSFRDLRYEAALFGGGVSDPEAAWQRVRSQVIYGPDPRYAWVAYYSRKASAETGTYAKVHIIVLKARNKTAFTDADLNRPATPYNVSTRPVANLLPRRVRVRLTEGGASPDIAHISPDNGTPYNGADAVAEGAFLVISEDLQVAKDPNNRSLVGLANGRVYRFGSRRFDLDETISGVNWQAWELVPGFDMPSGPGCGGPGPDLELYTADDNQNLPLRPGDPSAIGFVMGRSFANPANAAGGFEGPAMDVAYFTTYISMY